MNRYLADGLAHDMHQGKRILFVAENHAIAREAMYQTKPRAFALGGAKHERWSAGEERLSCEDSGGFIRFVSYRSKSHRGINVDLVFLHGEKMDVTEYLPMLATNPTAEIMRA